MKKRRKCTILLVLVVAGAAHTVGLVAEAEGHAVFAAHAADHAAAAAAVVLADEEGEVNEADLALVDLRV